MRSDARTPGPQRETRPRDVLIAELFQRLAPADSLSLLLQPRNRPIDVTPLRSGCEGDLTRRRGYRTAHRRCVGRSTPARPPHAPTANVSTSTPSRASLRFIASSVAQVHWPLRRNSKSGFPRYTHPAIHEDRGSVGVYVASLGGHRSMGCILALVGRLRARSGGAHSDGAG
jgi:hypothetical protein